MRVEVWAGALMLAAALSHPAAADEKTYVMKLSTATINDSQHQWIKDFIAAVEKDSGGRIKGEAYPASQLGSIQRQIEGTQFGSIQGWIGPPEFLSGVDERFEVMSTPGFVKDNAHGVRMTLDPELKKMVLALGANKGLHGVSLFIAQPSAIIDREPIRHLADLKGKKLRVLASDFQDQSLIRLGASPVAMTLADVLPAIQQGTIDGAVAAMTVYTTQKYYDVAKYVTETGQPYIFSVAELSRKWYEGLPKDLQQIIDKDGDTVGKAMNPWELDFWTTQRKVWTEKGGEIIALPPDEQASMMKTLATVGDDLSKAKPALRASYETFVAAAKRTQ